MQTSQSGGGCAEEEGVAVVLASEPVGALDAAVHRLGISAAGYTLFVHPDVAFAARREWSTEKKNYRLRNLI